MSPAIIDDGNDSSEEDEMDSSTKSEQNLLNQRTIAHLQHAFVLHENVDRLHDPNLDQEIKLDFKDWIALTIALLETIWLPIFLMLLVVVALAMFIGMLA